MIKESDIANHWLSEPIGADTEIIAEKTAMHIVPRKNDWIMQGELPLQRAFIAKEQFYLEFMVDPKKSYIQSGDELHVAQYPYSMGFVGSCTFKKKGKTLVARLNTCDQEFPKTRNQNSIFLYGLCKDSQLLIAQMWQHKHIQNLLKWTEDRTIKFGYRPKKSGKIDTSHLVLYPEVRNKAEDIMSQSIKQSLAGPHQENESWIGKSITHLIDWIYREHLHRHNQLAHYYHKRKTPNKSHIQKLKEPQLEKKYHAFKIWLNKQGFSKNILTCVEPYDFFIQLQEYSHVLSPQTLLDLLSDILAVYATKSIFLELNIDKQQSFILDQIDDYESNI